MLKTLTIKELYVPALAEGEGVGTAYEYFAKRLVLARWLKNKPKPVHVLIAGLPEKYGSSLDFLQLVQEFGAAVTIVDERPSALQKVQNSLAAAQKEGWLTAVSSQLVSTSHLADLSPIDETFDLCLGSEGLQRLEPDDRPDYVRHVRRLASRAALFAPNGDNMAHTNISGLAGVTLGEMQQLVGVQAKTGYMDMPPFPPGITRSEDQREQATSGTMEAIAMWGLGYYARLEHFLPTAVRRKQSHIVYALMEMGD